MRFGQRILGIARHLRLRKGAIINRHIPLFYEEDLQKYKSKQSLQADTSLKPVAKYFNSSCSPKIKQRKSPIVTDDFVLPTDADSSTVIY